MRTMEKQKSKHGVIEVMPNGKVYGYVNVSKMTDEREFEIIEDYIDLGFVPVSNKYSLAGGGIQSIDFKYLDEDGIAQEGDMPYLNHGILIMKTELKRYVSTKD